MARLIAVALTPKLDPSLNIGSFLT